MAGITLDPSILGLEGQLIEVNMAVIKIAGIEIPNGIVTSFTGVGHSREQSDWVPGLGQSLNDKFTTGIMTPKDISLKILVAVVPLIKQAISITGKWAKTRFPMSLQFQPPASAIVGLPGITGLPTLTWTFDGCLLMDDGTGAETGAVIAEWTVRPGKIDTPSGIGI